MPSTSEQLNAAAILSRPYVPHRADIATTAKKAQATTQQINEATRRQSEQQERLAGLNPGNTAAIATPPKKIETIDEQLSAAYAQHASLQKNNAKYEEIERSIHKINHLEALCKLRNEIDLLTGDMLTQEIAVNEKFETWEKNKEKNTNPYVGTAFQDIFNAYFNCEKLLVEAQDKIKVLKQELESMKQKAYGAKALAAQDSHWYKTNPLVREHTIYIQATETALKDLEEQYNRLLILFGGLKAKIENRHSKNHWSQQVSNWAYVPLTLAGVLPAAAMYALARHYAIETMDTSPGKKTRRALKPDTIHAIQRETSPFAAGKEIATNIASKDLGHDIILEAKNGKYTIRTSVPKTFFGFRKQARVLAVLEFVGHCLITEYPMTAPFTNEKETTFTKALNITEVPNDKARALLIAIGKKLGTFKNLGIKMQGKVMEFKEKDSAQQKEIMDEAETLINQIFDQFATQVENLPEGDQPGQKQYEHMKLFLGAREGMGIGMIEAEKYLGGKSAVAEIRNPKRPLYIGGVTPHAATISVPAPPPAPPVPVPAPPPPPPALMPAAPPPPAVTETWGTYLWNRAAAIGRAVSETVDEVFPSSYTNRM